jgi:hypothetical protein
MLVNSDDVKITKKHRGKAPVAQGIEQRISNPPVAGSNPAGRAYASDRTLSLTFAQARNS